MDLREAINQKQFTDVYEECLINIIYTYNWLKTGIKEHLKPFGLTMQQYNVLRILNGAYPQPITTSTVRARMLDKMSDASRIVDRLCKKNLAERKQCSDDKRLVDVVITEEGRKLIATIISNEDQLIDNLHTITEEEGQSLNNLLNKLRG